MQHIYKLIVFVAFLSPAVLHAQHEHEKMQGMMPSDTGSKKAAKEMKYTGADHMQHMTHAYSIHLPMNRNGSGTAWLPDESPMYMYMWGKKTMWMLHGNIFLRYSNTDIFNSGSRGSDKIGAPNWFMLMMNRRIGKRGLLTAKAMMSLDRITEGGRGYPLLFQSGETWKGARLVDRQHPHDLFSELSLGYSYAFNKKLDLFGYVAYPGEPSLSAPAFMHRVSAMNMPDAPLGHHWQDATHITFGVGTIGIRYGKLKLEGSIFTGREPDEDRFNFDKWKFDSYSYRLSFNPSPLWALQFSQGFVNEPEKLEPGVDVTRTTASVLLSKPVGKSRHFDAALIWGYNSVDEDHQQHSFLVESNYRFGRNTIFGRYEYVNKSAEELALAGHEDYAIHALSAGYNRSLRKFGPVELAVGTQLTLNITDNQLRDLYGDSPLGFQVYIQLRPRL